MKHQFLCESSEQKKQGSNDEKEKNFSGGTNSRFAVCRERDSKSLLLLFHRNPEYNPRSPEFKFYGQRMRNQVPGIRNPRSGIPESKTVWD